MQLIKEANPPGFHSVLETVQRYRHPSKLVSEAGYVFTHVVSAVHFLETVSAARRAKLASYGEQGFYRVTWWWWWWVVLLLPSSHPGFDWLAGLDCCVAPSSPLTLRPSCLPPSTVAPSGRCGVLGRDPPAVRGLHGAMPTPARRQWRPATPGHQPD